MSIWWRKLCVCVLAAVMICTCTAGIGSIAAQELEESVSQEVDSAAELPDDNAVC